MVYSQNESIRGTQYCFTAFLDNVKTLYSVLKAINFQESAIFCATDQGLKITVEQNKCIQASAYISADNFCEYSVQGEEVELKVSLTVLTECLNIFGSGEESSLKMYYKEAGAPLLLVLEHLNAEDAMTDCEIRTQEPEELMYFKGDDEVSEIATLVVKGPGLLAVLGDLDKTAELVELTLSPDHPHFTIVTTSPQDKSRVEIPKSSDMIHSFSCSEAVTLKYKFSSIRLIMRALGLATKVAIKTDSRGLLVVQQMIEREEQRQMFVEYYITPLIDEDDD